MGIGLHAFRRATCGGCLPQCFNDPLAWVRSAICRTMGRRFASFYALYSGVALLTVVAAVLAPIVHRFLHSLHIHIVKAVPGRWPLLRNPSIRVLDYFSRVRLHVAYCAVIGGRRPALRAMVRKASTRRATLPVVAGRAVCLASSTRSSRRSHPWRPWLDCQW